MDLLHPWIDDGLCTSGFSTSGAIRRLFPLSAAGVLQPDFSVRQAGITTRDEAVWKSRPGVPDVPAAAAPLDRVVGPGAPGLGPNSNGAPLKKRPISSFVADDEIRLVRIVVVVVMLLMVLVVVVVVGLVKVRRRRVVAVGVVGRRFQRVADVVVGRRLERRIGDRRVHKKRTHSH